MSTLCCKLGLPNFGKPKNCVIKIDEFVGAIAMSTFTNAGAYNEVDLTDPFTASTLTGLITNTDVSLRWVKLPRFYDAKLTPADTVFDTMPDDTKFHVRDGIFTLTATMADDDAVPAVIAKLKALRCKNLSLGLTTRSNQLVFIGVPDSETVKRPLLVNKGSIDPKMMFKESTTTNKIMFSVDMDNLFKSENLYVIDGNEINVDFLNMRQLTDVNIVSVAPATTTTATVGLRTDFAMGLQPNFDVVGLTGANFTAKNLTTGLPITLGTVTEDLTIDGQYDVVFPAQTSGDVIELTLVTTTYYNGSVQITIP